MFSFSLLVFLQHKIEDQNQTKKKKKQGSCYGIQLIPQWTNEKSAHRREGGVDHRLKKRNGHCWAQ